MAILDRNAILAAKPATIDVAVPAWNGDVRVKAMTIADRLALLNEYQQNVQSVLDYEEDQKLPKGKQKKLPKVELYDQTILQLIHTIIDETGTLQFSAATDHDAFKALDYAVIQSLYRAFQKLNVPPEDTKKN